MTKITLEVHFAEKNERDLNASFRVKLRTDMAAQVLMLLSVMTLQPDYLTFLLTYRLS
jgi:hypothetical protein